MRVFKIIAGKQAHVRARSRVLFVARFAYHSKFATEKRETNWPELRTSGIVTIYAPISYWLIFFFVSSNIPRKFCESLLGPSFPAVSKVANKELDRTSYPNYGTCFALT